MRYFAYGSNMFFPRLKKRARSALSLGVARLCGYSLEWHKRSQDGSGKCSLSPSENGIVFGALFAIAISEEEGLAKAEGPGYQKITVQIEMGAERLAAETFVAKPEYIAESLRPYTWYRDLVVAGAVQAELPAEYVLPLKQVQADTDPDSERDLRERSSLPADLEKAGKGKEYLESLWDDPYDRELRVNGPLRRFEKRVLYPASAITLGLTVYYAVNQHWWMAAFMLFVDLFVVSGIGQSLHRGQALRKVYEHSPPALVEYDQIKRVENAIGRLTMMAIPVSAVVLAHRGMRIYFAIPLAFAIALAVGLGASALSSTKAMRARPGRSDGAG